MKWKDFVQMATLKKNPVIVLVAIILILCVIAVISVARAHGRAEAAVQVPDDIADMRLYWEREIDRSGAKAAYDEMKGLFGGDPARGHVAAHLIGGLLYAHLGADGIRVCDDSYGSGCYHGFVVDALSDKGPEFAMEIARLCGSLAGNARDNCVHGFGHGVIAFTGDSEFREALEICNQTFDSKDASNCAGGVFMAYNNPLDLSGLQFASLRPFDSAHPNSPCDTDGIRRDFLPICYYSLADYWWDNFPDAAKVASLCAASPAAYRDSCYRGMGIDIPNSVSFDEKKIVEECGKIDDMRGRRGCLDVAARTQEGFGKDACAIYRELGEEKSGC